LTAEAIGEDALSKHFDELRQRQRSLIAEYFTSLRQRPPGSSAMPGDDNPQGGAPVQS
jgi:adenylosuccinate lyase